MKSFLLLAGMLLFARGAYAQTPVTPDACAPELPRQATSVTEFASPGWKVEIEKRGDLNHDGVPDLVLVLRPVEEGAETKLAPRLLVVAMAKAAGYELALNQSRLLSGDPNLPKRARIEGVSIEGGLLRLFLENAHPAWSSLVRTRAFDFRYQDSRFELIRFDEDVLEHFSQRSSHVSIDYLSRMATVRDTFERPIKQQNKALPPGSPPSIETLGNGWLFQPAPCEPDWWKSSPGRTKGRARF